MPAMKPGMEKPKMEYLIPHEMAEMAKDRQ